MAVWLREIRDRVPGGIEVDWRYFSLEQVNERAGPGRQVWDRPAGFESATLEAFAGAEAARRQGQPERWGALHMAMLHARHVENAGLTAALVERLAGETGFDVDRFRRDVADPTILQALAEQHEEAVSRGVFGTPTIFFENGRGAYLKMLPAPTGDEALAAWDHLRPLIAEHAYLQEVKRPQKPKSV